MNEHFINDFKLYEETYLDKNRYGFIEIGTDGRIFLKSDKDSISLLINKQLIGKIKFKEKYSNIKMIDTIHLKNSYLEFKVNDSELFKYFFAIISDFLDMSLNRNLSLEKALLSALENVNAISRRLLNISKSKEIGLFGELFILDKLLDLGASYFELWQGHDKNRHDFVMDKEAFEIKTTKNIKRVHSVHGLHQLEERDNTQISIISIQLDTGNGDTLISLYKKILTKISKREQNIFRQQCVKCGLDESKYVESLDRSYTIRGEVRIYPVDKNFPTLTREKIKKLFIDNSSGILFVDAQYILDFTHANSYTTLSKKLKKL
jgi:hypothetical protein